MTAAIVERREETVARIMKMIPFTMVGMTEQNMGQYSGQRYEETLIVTGFVDKKAFIEFTTNRGIRRTGFTIDVKRDEKGDTIPNPSQRDLFLDWAVDKGHFLNPPPGVHLMPTKPLIIQHDDAPSGIAPRAARYIGEMAK